MEIEIKTIRSSINIIEIEEKEEMKEEIITD